MSDMKGKYEAPEVQVIEMELQGMIAESRDYGEQLTF